MTVSHYTLDAWVGATQLSILTGTLTLDESWAPYAQATLELPFDAALLTKLDPRSKTRLSISATQNYGTSKTLTTLSTLFTTKTIAAATTAWAPYSLGKISAAYFSPYNIAGSSKLSKFSSLYGGLSVASMSTAYGGGYVNTISSAYFTNYPALINSNYRRSFDLTLRSRTIDVAAATMTLELASDEALLQDFGLVSSLPFAPGILDLRTIVQGILAQVGDYLVDGTTTAVVPTDSATWAPGVSAWDYLQPLVQAAGLRLFCDEKRNWYLVTASYVSAGTIDLREAGTMTAATDSISRDDDLWADAVVITYTWTDALGATQLAYDTASVTGYSKVKHITKERPYPGAGAAAALLARTTARGRASEVSALSNYQTTPGQACTIVLNSFTTQAAYISSVTWAHPGDEMTIKTRTIPIGI